MKAINVYSFCRGINTLASLARRQPKDTASFFSKILAVRNSPDNLNKSQHVPQDINVHTGLIGKRQAPPRPVQPELALKLKMATVDFKQDPEMAREKWGLSKGIPEQHTGKREAPPRPAQPELELKLKMAMADFKQDPEMAREKWGLSKEILE